ncbi:MAG: hypothetical protein ACREOE_02020, partial [Gemmatimonadales bacterium]
TTAAGPPQPCTADDLAVSSSSDRSSYAPGQAVSMVTTLTARRTCVYQPVPTGQYSCAASVVVKSASGAQAWPWQGQGEVCNAPSATTLQAGSTESIVATWNGQVQQGGGQDAPPGSYVVAGTWSWSGGSGQPPVVVSIASPAFTIS